MTSLKGTQTEKNIMAAFAGESQARNRYTFFVSKAKKEGYVQVALAFEETANQEKEHAKRLFKFFEGGEAEITGSFPAGMIGTTAENLKGSAAGENHDGVEPRSRRKWARRRPLRQSRTVEGGDRTPP